MSKLRQYQDEAKIADLRTACRVVNAAHDYLEKKVEAQAARIAALEKALEPFASQHTVGETLMTCEVPPWAGLSPEQRLAMLAERKESHDANILTARALLNPTPTKGDS
jgi:hypothetical protein